jgi:tRNA(Ile)-lysidine synthase
VRLDLLPLLKQQFNPAIVKRLTAYAQLFQEDAFFIDKIAAERYIQLCEHAEDGVKIHLERFAKEDRTLQRALIYTMFQELTGVRQVLETDHARAVIDLFTHGETGERLSLPGGVLAIRSYTHGYLQRKPEPMSCVSALPVLITVPGKSTFDVFSVETEVLATIPPEWQSIKGSNTAQLITQCMDYDRISPPITVRYRLPGDRFCPLGMKGKKTLKKFFIDRKIPRDTRDQIPLFEDQQGIFWVTGYGVDDRVKITENTKKVLRCRVYKQVKSAKCKVKS